MEWDLLSGVIKDASITIIFGFLWWFERVDRRAAELRERELMLRLLPIGYTVKSSSIMPDVNSLP